MDLFFSLTPKNPDSHSEVKTIFDLALKDSEHLKILEVRKWPLKDGRYHLTFYFEEGLISFKQKHEKNHYLVEIDHPLLDKKSFLDHFREQYHISSEIFDLEKAEDVMGPASQNSRLLPLFVMTIVVATCSMLYELVLAQALSSILGNTMMRYNLTIGLFIASMGIGALMYGKLLKGRLDLNLIRVELALTIVGGLCPILALFFDSLFKPFPFLILIATHFLIVAVGFISGLELPLLMDMGKKISSTGDNKVLALDYIGTLLGAVLFPLFILPYFSIFTTAFIVALFNCLVAGYLVLTGNIRGYKEKTICATTLAILVLSLIYHNEINHFIVEKLYF
jgi:hypothetical protein